MGLPDRMIVRGFSLSAAIAAISITLAVTAYAADEGAGAVLASARVDIAAQTGVHVVFMAHSGSTGITERIVADVGASAGSETVFEGSAHLALRATPSFAYVSGNSSGLTTLFGMGSADAKTLGSKWESWKAGTGQYVNLKETSPWNRSPHCFPKPRERKCPPKFVRRALSTFLLGRPGPRQRYRSCRTPLPSLPGDQPSRFLRPRPLQEAREFQRSYPSGGRMLSSSRLRLTGPCPPTRAVSRLRTFCPYISIAGPRLVHATQCSATRQVSSRRHPLPPEQSRRLSPWSPRSRQRHLSRRRLL